MLSCVVAEAPEEKPSGGAGITKSSFASSVLTPCGTVRWIVYISSRSRRQDNLFPLAKNIRPVKSVIGPVGPCSPGIHLGNTSFTSPAATGISICACRICSGAWVASTVSLIGCDGTALAAACGLRFWAGLAMAVMTKANRTILQNNFVMVGLSLGEANQD